jgi:opacity protein-like surface antigen
MYAIPWAGISEKSQTTMNTLTRDKAISSKAGRLVALGAMVLAALALQAQESGKDYPQRAGVREFYLGVGIFTAPTIAVNNVTLPGVGTHDSVMSFDDAYLYGLGFGYGLNDHFNLNGEMNWGNMDYRMNWGPYELKGTGSLFTSRLNLDYNIMKTRLTPVVTGGIGYDYFDSGIPKGSPEYVCWWDPWWGYVCNGYVETHHTSEFTWNAGVGLRYDMTSGLFLKLLYDVTWMKVGAAGTQAFPEYQLQLGWKW